MRLRVRRAFHNGGTVMAKSKQAGKVTAAKVDLKDCAARVEAVSKALAVIELNLDGTVTTANDNFL